MKTYECQIDLYQRSPPEVYLVHESQIWHDATIKVYLNDPDHVTNMAAISKHGKKNFKNQIFFSRT